MGNNEIMTLSVDVSEADMPIKEIGDAIVGLKEIVNDIGISITKAFAPMQKSLQKIEGSILLMTGALLAATQEIGNFTSAFLELQTVNQSVQGLSNDFNTILSVVGSIAGVAAALLAAEVAAPIVGLVAIIMGVISALFLFWDDISAFFVNSWNWLMGILSDIGTWIHENVILPASASLSGFWSDACTLVTDAWNSIIAILCAMPSWVDNNIIKPVVTFFSNLWADICNLTKAAWNGIIAVLCAMPSWIDNNVIQPVAQFFVNLWTDICNFATGAWNGIIGVFSAVASWFNTNVIQPVAEFFSGLWTDICNFATDAWDGIVEVFSAVATWFDQNVVQPVAEFFSGLWDGICDTAQTAWDGIVAVIKEPLNSIIGFINGLVSGVVSGVNTIIRALNGLSFTVPDWVPVLGGSSFGFNIRTLTAPQIPYLAKGAVLPANRPFLAVVGDQRHGTNIEAPLTTIQEAVAVVMQEHISAMMAGFQALLDEQRATRRTIEGIEIGDSVIGQAAERYNSKMAVARGVWY